MQKIRACLQKTPNALLCALGAVVFLAGFYFLCYRTPLNEVWLPTTMNNDEALYNRQVVSVLTHGGPQGYFGYQESTADIGRYGTWGPAADLGLRAAGSAVRCQRKRCAVVQFTADCRGHRGVCPLRAAELLAVHRAVRRTVQHYAAASLLRQRRVGGHALHAGALIVGTAAALHRSGRTGWLIACAAPARWKRSSALRAAVLGVPAHGGLAE